MQNYPNPHLPNKLIMKKLIGLFKGLLILLASMSFGTLYGQTNSLVLDGKGAYLDIPESVSTTSDEFTFETWFYYTGAQRWARIMDFGNDAKTNMFLTSCGGTANVSRFMIYNAGKVEAADSKVALQPGNWYHIAIVFEGKAFTMYLNGESVAEKTFTYSPADLGVLQNRWIGKSHFSWDDYLNSKLAETRIWNVARTADEIKESMSCALDGSEEGLSALYQFKVAADSIAVDTKGMHYGTLRGDNGVPALVEVAEIADKLKDCSSTEEIVAGDNNALLLNGTSSFVAGGDFLTPSYTKEVWVKLDVDNLKTNNNIISGRSGHAFRFINGIADAGHSGRWTEVQDPQRIEAGWQHYAVTYDDSTQVMTLYRNGEQVAQRVGVSPNTDASVQIGSFSSCCYFRGMMDEVRIWDHARDAEDVAVDYNRALTGKEPGLLAYYSFNQGIANGDNTGIVTVTDLTGKNDGTLSNFALTVNSTSNFVQSDLGIGAEEVVITNNALHLDGTKDYVDARATATGLPQGREPRTMEAWVKTTQTSIGNFISWGRRATRMRNSMAIRNGKLAYIGQYLDFTGKTPINDGEWHHVALSYDGENWAIYVDGTADGTNGGDPNTTDQNLKIGNLPEPHNGEYFDGTMDELRVWNVARTADEIVASMNTELTGKEEGLVAYYNFNQGVAGGDNSTVTTLMDLAGKNNGTLSDFALTGDASNWVASNPALESISTAPIPAVKVLGAIWGVGDNNANCTTEVQALANNPTTPFKVNGGNLGTDPKYGHTKELRVAYEIKDVVYFRKQKDHSTFEFLGASKNPKITIQQAIWGISGHESDVKDMIQNLVDQGAVGFISQGTVLGKDPKYGTKKTLKLVYEVGGETYQKEVKDHDFIYLTTAFEDAVKGVETNVQDD